MAEVLGHAWQRARHSGIAQILFGAGGLVSSIWRPTAEDLAFLQASCRRY